MQLGVIMTLQQLKYIVEIYHCGSITEAARKLFVAQPSLSKVVKDLEDEFQIQILHRSRHGVSFTEDGIAFLKYARRIIDASDAMTDYFTGQNDGAKSIELSVSSQHYVFPVDAMVKVVNNVPHQQRYTVRIHEVRTSQVIQDVLTQVSQIGILYVSSMIQNYMYRLFEQNDLQFTPFYDFPPFVYVRKDHPLGGKKSVSIEALEEFPYIRYEQGGDPDQFSEELVITRVSSKQTIYVTDRSSMFAFLLGTRGYTLGTGCILPHLVPDNIVSVPLEGVDGFMQIGWLKKKQTVLPAIMDEYVKQMEQSLLQGMHESIPRK